ncbi:MAG: hypothetical protein QOH17_4090 [Pseudonocardiales bacterium]|nr:hypothetical protein [Pseudonocardiales bacterium]
MTEPAPRGEQRAVLFAVAVVAVPMVALGIVRLLLQLPQGDEPHYLVISQALHLYGSLDVQQVYDHRDYWSYYPMPLDPHISPGPDGQPLPLHSIGGPVLWLLPFALWGRAGVVAFMTVVSLAIVANVYWLVRSLEVRRSVAVGVAVAFGLGTPVLMYASLTFVEPLGALGCVYALRLLHSREIGPGNLLLVSTVLGALPWIHSRFLLFPPILGAFLLVRVWREGRSPARLACLLAPAAVLIGGLLVYDAVVWHVIGLAPNQVNAGAVPFTADPRRALVGIVLDQEVGVVPNFPVLLFVLPGLLLARRRALTWHVAALVVPYVAVITSFPAWDGAWSPPARFLAVILPLLAGHIGLAWERAGRSTLVLAGALTAVGAGLTTLAVCSATGGFSAQRGRSPALGVLDSLSGVDVGRVVPSLAQPGQVPLFLAWAVLTLGFGLVSLRGRRDPATPAARPLPRPGWSR